MLHSRITFATAVAAVAAFSLGFFLLGQLDQNSCWQPGREATIFQGLAQHSHSLDRSNWRAQLKPTKRQSSMRQCAAEKFIERCKNMSTIFYNAKRCKSHYVTILKSWLPEQTQRGSKDNKMISCGSREPVIYYVFHTQ